jgi:hypothetical protein
MDTGIAITHFHGVLRCIIRGSTESAIVPFRQYTKDCEMIVPQGITISNSLIIMIDDPFCLGQGLREQAYEVGGRGLLLHCGNPVLNDQHDPSFASIVHIVVHPAFFPDSSGSIRRRSI